MVEEEEELLLLVVVVLEEVELVWMDWVLMVKFQSMQDEMVKKQMQMQQEQYEAQQKFHQEMQRLQASSHAQHNAMGQPQQVMQSPSYVPPPQGYYTAPAPRRAAHDLQL